MRTLLTRLFRLVTEAIQRFGRHGDLLAGSLAFFALLSIAPLAVIAISVASLIVEREHVRESLSGALQNVASPQISSQLLELVDAVDMQRSGLGSVLAALLLLLAASRLFTQVEQALNLIWDVKADPASSTRERVQRLIVKRLVSFAMVIACGLLLLSMLVAQAMLVVIGAAASQALSVELAVFGPPLVFFFLLTLLFALIYRVLPDTDVQFGDVWVGAATTAVLVLLGTWLLGLYLTKIAPEWLQGAAGAVAAFMVWAYYLAQVFLFGASFTRSWALSEWHVERRGRTETSRASDEQVSQDDAG